MNEKIIRVTSRLPRIRTRGQQESCNLIFAVRITKRRRFLYWVGAVFPRTGTEEEQKYNFIPFADRFYLHQGKFGGDLVTFPQIYNKCSYNCFVLRAAKCSSFQDQTHLRYELCVRVYAGNRKGADYL